MLISHEMLILILALRPKLDTWLFSSVKMGHFSQSSLARRVSVDGVNAYRDEWTSQQCSILVYQFAPR